MSLWVLQMPDGKLAETTVAETYDECWGNSFYLVDEYFRSNGFKYKGKYSFEFKEAFWKKWDPSLNCALRNGFDIVECRLHRIPE